MRHRRNACNILDDVDELVHVKDDDDAIDVTSRARVQTLGVNVSLIKVNWRCYIHIVGPREEEF
jgi:hypothetical protein